MNKVNPSEFDPLQEKGKKDEVSKEPGQVNNSEPPNSQPSSLPPTPGPVQPGLTNQPKYYPTPSYGEFFKCY